MNPTSHRPSPSPAHAARHTQRWPPTLTGSTPNRMIAAGCCHSASASPAPRVRTSRSRSRSRKPSKNPARASTITPDFNPPSPSPLSDRPAKSEPPGNASQIQSPSTSTFAFERAAGICRGPSPARCRYALIPYPLSAFVIGIDGSCSARGNTTGTSSPRFTVWTPQRHYSGFRKRRDWRIFFSRASTASRTFRRS